MWKYALLGIGAWFLWDSFSKAHAGSLPPNSLPTYTPPSVQVVALPPNAIKLFTYGSTSIYKAGSQYFAQQAGSPLALPITLSNINAYLLQTQGKG